jgi:TonB family protein
MIPRTLVPPGARLPDGEITTARRRPSSLDERTLVPSSLPVVPLNGQSTIPSNLPLDSIAARVVVPRDIDVEAVQRADESNLPPQPTEMDERITIPQGVAPPEILPTVLPMMSEELVEPDIIQTGELSFLPPVRRAEKATIGEIIVVSASLTLNLLFIVAIYFILTYRPHGQEVDEIARNNMQLLLPPGALESLKPSAPPPPRPRVRVDPRDIRRVAPSMAPPPPTPTPVQPKPEPPKRELPSAPAPQVVTPTPQPPQGNQGELPKTPLKLETPSMPVPQSGLVLPKQGSPGSAIRDAERSLKPNAPVPIGGGGPIGGVGRGGGGRGSAGGAIEMLTDTEGVDFNDYLRRVYIIVKGNWFAVMPSSVQLGDNGEVSLTFKIYQNGSVVDSDPRLVYGSGKEPLDRAAVSSIRASNPFPPLPGQFKAPYIELRYTYCYNEQSCPAGR